MSTEATTLTSTTGKRDKRRQTIALRINYISEQFENDRNDHYREMLHALQSTLSSLHAGTNPEFLEKLADLEEQRDQELLRLRLWEEYRIERTESEYQREVEAANEEYGRLTLLVKERLMERLENQRKSLREDKALLDIANDHMVFLNNTYANGGSGYYSSTCYSNSINNQNNGINSGTNNIYSNNNSGNNNNNGNNSNTEDPGNISTRYSNGYYSGGGGNASPGFYASERRHLRRRGDHGTTSALDDASGMSGNEGRNGYGSAAGRRTDGGVGTASKRRKVGGRGLQSGGEDGVLQSDKETLEGILFQTNNSGVSGAGNHSSVNGGHSSISRPSKSYQSPAALKSEDSQNDLAQLRVAVASIKRKRGEK